MIPYKTHQIQGVFNPKMITKSMCGVQKAGENGINQTPGNF